jgi:hypothetical protein
MIQKWSISLGTNGIIHYLQNLHLPACSFIFENRLVMLHSSFGIVKIEQTAVCLRKTNRSHLYGDIFFPKFLEHMRKTQRLQ